jgi:hypothetical protein
MEQSNEIRIRITPIKKILSEEFFSHQIIIPYRFITLEEVEFKIPKLNANHYSRIRIPSKFNAIKEIEEIIEERMDNNIANRTKPRGRIKRISKRLIKQTLLNETKHILVSQSSEINNVAQLSKEYGISYDKVNKVIHNDIYRNNVIENRRRGRKAKFPENYIPLLKEFILRDDNKGVGVLELKIKFEREMNDSEITAKNLGYWSYYNIIKNKKYLNLSYKRIKNYCLNKFNDRGIEVDRRRYARQLVYYIRSGYKIFY